MSYKTPNIVLLENPVLDDAVIQDIQTKLSQIPWITHAFGRARIFKEDSGDSMLNVPRVFGGQHSSLKNAEYIDVFPTDQWKAFCFFLKEGQSSSEDSSYKVGSFSSFTAPYSVLFWAQLDLIDNTIDGDFTRKLEKDVLDVLRFTTSVRNVRIADENAEQVFSGMDILAYRDRQNFDYPHTGFRIYFDLSFNESDYC